MTRRPYRPEEEGVLRRLRVSMAIMVVIGGVGTLGYLLVWNDQHPTFLDAAYMTVITMTTIGFQEVRPLGTAGRLLTMGIAVTGVASLFYALGALMEYVVLKSHLAVGGRQMQRQIEKLSGHTIVVGLGRVGQQAAAELEEGQRGFVAVDVRPAVLEMARTRGWLCVEGDATVDEVLVRAGIHRASGLVVTADADPTNLYVVISARFLNPALRIVSRAGDEESISKLRRAGADRAVNPYATGGRRLAHLLSSPNLVDFFDSALAPGEGGPNIEEEQIPVGSASIGQPLARVRPGGAGSTVLAVIRRGAPLVGPRPDLLLEEGDLILTLGASSRGPG